MTPQPKESLWLIEETLQGLIETRDLAESEGDSEALKVIDQQIEQYLSKEEKKIDSYASLIRQRNDYAEACEQEAARLMARAKQFRADEKRLKDTALKVMQTFGVKVLQTTKTTLRVQANGGVEPLEASGVTAAKWQKIIVTLPALVWIDLMGLAESAARDTATFRELEKLTRSASRTPDTTMIRAALNSGQSVPGAHFLPKGEHLRIG